MKMLRNLIAAVAIVSITATTVQPQLNVKKAATVALSTVINGAKMAKTVLGNKAAAIVGLISIIGALSAATYKNPEMAKAALKTAYVKAAALLALIAAQAKKAGLKIQATNAYKKSSEYVKAKAKYAKETASDIAKRLKKQAQEKVQNLYASAKNKANNVVNNVKTSKVVVKTTKGMNIVKNGFVSAKNSIKSAFSDIKSTYNSVKNYKVVNTVANKAKAVLVVAKDGVVNAFNKVKNSSVVNTVSTKAINAYNTVANKTTNVAKNVWGKLFGFFKKTKITVPKVPAS